MPAYRVAKDTAAAKVSGRRKEEVRTYYTVPENAAIFHNYFCLEFDLFTSLSGAVPLLPELEAKCEISHHLHSGMLRARAMRERLVDFLITEPEQKLLPKWTNFVRHLMTAPDDFVLLSALYHVIRPAQLKCYEVHRRTTLQINDAPTAELMERSLEGLRQDIAWGQDFITRKTAGVNGSRRAAREFEKDIRQHLRALGGPMGITKPKDAPTPKRYPAWKPPKEMTLEERFEVRSVDRYTLPGWADYEAIPSAYTHFTELPVIDIVGVTVFDGRALKMPFDYYADFVRQLWDEARHSMMGFERLQAFGVDPYKVPIPVGHYAIWANFSVLERLASLTQVGEACSFEPKRQWVHAAWKRHDPLSALEHEYDIVDERTHVRFGKRWIHDIMERTNEQRPVKQVVQDADWKFRGKINRMRKKANENWVKDLGERFMGCGTNTSPVSLAPALAGIPNIIA